MTDESITPARLAPFLAQWDYFAGVLFDRLSGLTDEEYLWEPVTNCWTVRPTGDGRYMADWEWPAPDPAPFTTIAWRMSHIGGPVFGWRAANHFGDGMDIEATLWPGTASDGIRFVEDGYKAWLEGISAMSDQDLWRPVGEAEGSYAKEPFIGLILHLNREFFHHGAEVALLRDLYRDSPR